MKIKEFRRESTSIKVKKEQERSRRKGGAAAENEKGETEDDRDEKNREVRRVSEGHEGNNLSLRTNNDQTEAGLRERQREMSS